MMTMMDEASLSPDLPIILAAFPSEPGARLERVRTIIDNGDITSRHERLVICEEGIRLARQLDRQTELADLLRIGADNHSRLSQYNTAREWAKEAAGIFELLGDQRGRAMALITLGGALIQIGEFSQAELHLTDALRSFRALGDLHWEAMALTYLGVASYQLGEYDQATTYYLDAMSIEDARGESNGVAGALVNLGLIALESENLDGALDYFSRSLEIFQETNDRYGIAAASKNLGDAYFRRGDYTRAMEGHSECLRIASLTGERYQAAGALGGLGEVYAALGDYEKAIDYHHQALAVETEIGDRQGMINALLHLGVIHRRQGKMQESLDALHHAQESARELGARALLFRTHLELGQTYEQMGELASALRHYKDFYRVRTEVLSEKADTRLRHLQTRMSMQRIEREAEINRLKAERMEHELMLARRVQLSLLPQEPPSVAGLRVATFCLPALEAGGDYFDFFRLDDHLLGIAIGDVTGKGMPAAIYMTLVKGILKSHALVGITPGEVLKTANRLVYETFSRGSFASMIYAIIDTRQHRLTYACAGHNPLLMIRDGQAVVPSDQKSMALGLTGSEKFDTSLHEVTVDLQTNDLLILYTDGFSEAMNAAREDYGDERVLSTALTHATSSPDELLDAVRDDVFAFVGRTPQHDDMTMIVVQVESADTPLAPSMRLL